MESRKTIDRFLANYSDVALAALVIGMVGMMIIPLPTLLLDLLLTLNITVAVTLLMVSLYIPSAVRIAAFPSILLLTTLFRLALNVSSTRLILLQADAGEVIESFGQFVVQGNYVVGAVIFLILTIIQFLVIAKGSERVSEVAARFTLDAMPGKQMAIDADLRAGAFDLDEARTRRAAVQRESQLYGAMDGAMKFVKGDAIAGVIITAINIIAGMVVGIVQQGMGAGEAAKIYTLLTIGDGLVSQIPALLIATTAGIIVTRVASTEGDSHLGSDIFSQILAHPKALAISASLLVGMALIPGLPTVPFLAMGLAVGVVAFRLLRGAREIGVEEQIVEDVKAEAEQGATQARAMIPAVTPLSLELNRGLAESLGDDGLARLRERVPRVREGIFFDRGIKVPAIRVRSTNRDGMGFVISIEEIPVASGELPPGKLMVPETVDGLRMLRVEGEPTRHPVSGRPCAWISVSDEQVMNDAGIKVWPASEVVLMHLSAAVLKNSSEFLTLQSVQDMLNQLEGPYPTTVQEVVPRLLTVQALTDILRRLAEEGISIRNLSRILQVLADRAQNEKDPLVLAESVREGLSRYITHRWATSPGELVAYVVDRAIEDQVAGAVRFTDTGAYLALPPEVTRQILDAIEREVRRDVDAGRTPVLLTDQRARRYLKKLAEIQVPEVVVLAYQELEPSVRIEPVARISVTR